MIDRRTFLATAGGAVAAAGGAVAAAKLGIASSSLGAAPSPLGTSAAPGARPAVDRIGLQLYTVRDRMAQDVERTLDEVAAIGYREVEFAGYFGRSPDQIRSAINAAGVHAPASHVPFEAAAGPRGRDAPGDEWAAVLEAAATAGHQWVVIAWIPQQARGGRAAWRRLAERFNQAGEAARAAGLRFAYHNHDFEFEPVGLRIPLVRPEGRGLPFDILIEETEPELVDFEIDVYWTASGGADALEYFARHPGRFRLAHLKDMDAQGRMVDPGEGQIDFAAILARAEQAGLEHAFVEHDQPADSMATARAGLAHLAPMVGSGSGAAGASRRPASRLGRAHLPPQSGESQPGDPL